MAKSVKSFSSFDGDFLLPLSNYEFQLGENFNCSYNETILSVLDAMDETEIPKSLIKKFGVRIKRNKLINSATDDESGLEFIYELIKHLNANSDESFWQIISTTDDKKSKEYKYIQNLANILSKNDVAELIDLVSDFDNCEYLFLKINYFEK